MSVYIELTTDGFVETFKQRSVKTAVAGRAGAARARRPVRGIEIKEDTFALIRVIQSNGEPIELFDSLGDNGKAKGAANFLIQQTSEGRMEKHQIVETFGDSYIFFFGEAPRFLDVQAVLLNTLDFNWEAEWWENYENYFRGTKLAELGARIYLFIDDTIVEGYVLECKASKTSMMPYSIQMQFRLFVTNYSNITFVGDPFYPVHHGAEIPAGVSLGDPNAAETLLIGSAINDFSNSRARENDELLRSALNQGMGQPNSFVSGQRISDLLRAVPPSYGFSPDVFNDLLGNDKLRELAYRQVNGQALAIRGRISDNVDEIVGTTKTGTKDLELIDDSQQPENFQRQTVQSLSCYGADVNDPALLNQLGVGPMFGAGFGASFGVGAFASAGAGTGFGSGAFAGASASAGGVGAFAAGAGPSGFADTGTFSRDPLSAVFGPSLDPTQFGTQRQQLVEGVGDYSYGYASAFAGGPGYGSAGFGDMGGAGFGSVFGSGGDPGFRKPGDFTFAGVADERDAYERFIAQRHDTTALTPGGGMNLATSGLGGGANLTVGGLISAFSLVAVPGTLDPTGNARDELDTSGDPFGTNCPTPPDTGGISNNYSYVLP